MTDKELQKLGRRELLQLLLDQAKETERLREELAAADERARGMEETFQRLRDRLDEKDAKIREQGETYDRLRDRLNDKDAEIQKLNETLQAEREGRLSGLANVGSIAEAALRLNGIFEAAQKAADLYLLKVHEKLPAHEDVVFTQGDVVAEPAPPPEPPRTAAVPHAAPVVDVEPKEERAPDRPAAAPEPAEPQQQSRFKRKKRKDGRGKFVFSFGWEDND